MWNTFYTRLLCAENNVPRDGPRSETREPEPDCPRPIDARDVESARPRDTVSENDARRAVSRRSHGELASSRVSILNKTPCSYSSDVPTVSL